MNIMPTNAELKKMGSVIGGHARRRSRKAGLPPGTMVHIGEQKVDVVKLTVIDFDAQRIEQRDLDRVEETFAFRDTPSVTWLNVSGLHAPSIITAIGEHYGIHSLTLEDILHTDQRPKVEVTDGSVYIVLKMLVYDAAHHHIEAEQISLILGPTYVITFQERDGDVLEPLRRRLLQDTGRVRKQGADYLTYAIIDVIVDHYFAVLENIGEAIEQLERDVLEKPDHTLVQKIQHMKRDLIFLRKATWPLREVIASLTRDEIALIQKGTQPYLRDIYDHIVQVIDMVENFRDLVSGLLDIYLSSVNTRMNEIMKVLTIIATIFIPLTFIVGVYGMNFEVMPELHWPWSYPVLWVFMVSIIVAMLAFFRVKKWI